MIDIGEYCREVEDYLTRANGGHLVRIVGAGFELVRGWAEAGIPLGIVFRGIDAKLERRRDARPLRPLRIEFCDDDVRSLFDSWRRAVGVSASRPDRTPTEPLTEVDADDDKPRASLVKQIDRAIDRLGRTSGRLDQPEPLREAIAGWLGELTSLREAVKRVRGPARQELGAALGPIDARIAGQARAAAPGPMLADLTRDAERDLAAFRDRLPGAAWQHAVDVTVDRLLRDRFGLPTLT